MYYTETKKLIELKNEFTEVIEDLKNNNEDFDIYDELHMFCDNAVIYYYECDQILKNNNNYWRLDHHGFGVPENKMQAAYVVVYDYLTDNYKF